VSWWPGDGNAVDIKNGNPGDPTGGTSFAPGVVGMAFSFDGVDGGVAVADAENLAITGSLTIEGWALIDSCCAPGSFENGQILFRGDDRGSLDPYYLAARQDGTIRFHIEAANRARVDLEAPIPSGRFVHVAATLNDSTGLMRLYLDGDVVAETMTSVRPFGPLDAQQVPGLGIGNIQEPAQSRFNQPFDGLIDELSIYSRALSAEEINEIVAAGSAGKCKPPSLEDLLERLKALERRVSGLEELLNVHTHSYQTVPGKRPIEADTGTAQFPE
jgi:hypothetical protein